MSGHKEVTFQLDFRACNRRSRESAVPSPVETGIPRIARLMALAIRFDALLEEQTIADYAELARLGKVTRARMTQIMKLRQLAPDLQEQILFLPEIRGLNERNLRPVVSLVDWSEQRRLFRKMLKGWRSSESQADYFAELSCLCSAAE